jgi:hypothetical protein
MKNLSSLTRVYILGIILVGFGMMIWMTINLDWTNSGLYVFSALGAVAPILKVEGPNNKTNYSLAWFVYGFVFILFGPTPTLFVMVVAHLAEWIWHRYPWYIQCFNIVAHAIPDFLTGLVLAALSPETAALSLSDRPGIVTTRLVFVLGNHFLVGLVVKMARGQSFAQSGIFEFLTLFLDFTVLSMGTVTALVWQSSPYAAVLNILPLYVLHKALQVPALKWQIQEMKTMSPQVGLNTGGD